MAFKYVKESLPLLKVGEMQIAIQKVSSGGLPWC